MENELKKELRFISEPIKATGNRTIEGYAIIFNSLSVDLGGFKEIILPSSINQLFVDTQDVICVFNHNNNLLLARSKKGRGTLKLIVDDKGLYYSFQAPKTPTGDEILENIRLKNITGSSFGFVVDENGQSWERKNGFVIRTISKIKMLVDVSPVTTPAYEASSVSSRSIFETYKKKENDLRELEIYLKNNKGLTDAELERYYKPYNEWQIWQKSVDVIIR